ncbi:MAG: MFS transporter [Holosporales bacterium]|jgi:MHS family proline/betaine transporter-like MFS transporter|nr:MFS transporter [Holosporales bacterium]
MNKKLIFACAIGSALEWFDYALYGTFAATLAKLFFPPSGSSSLMWTYLIFAFGFFSRPLGGIIFGHIGDKVSRKTALIISILTMAFPTFATGLLPTFQTIGIWAPILLAVIRLLQGIAIGGEFTGAMVYLVENSPAEKRGFFGCWSDFGSPFGVALGLLVSGILTSCLSVEDFESFGWRIPFLFGIVISLFGAYLRYGIADDEESSPKSTKDACLPIVETVKRYKKTITYIVFINAFGGSLFYMLVTYLHNYFKVFQMTTTKQALLVTSIVNAFITLAVPLGGILSDKFGRKKVMIICVVITLLCVYPAFYTLNVGLLYIHLFFEIVFGICLGVFWGGRAAFYTETFPYRLRCTAVAFAFGISHSVFAGTTPLVAEFLIEHTGSCYSLGCLIALFAILALYSLHKLEDRTAKNLT